MNSIKLLKSLYPTLSLTAVQAYESDDDILRIKMPILVFY